MLTFVNVTQVFSDVKYKSSIVSGARHFFSLVQLVQTHCTAAEKKVAFKTLQDNAFFAHPENVLLAMCGKFQVKLPTSKVIIAGDLI